MKFSRSVFFLNEIKWDTQTLNFALALALLPQRLLLLILVLGLYDGVSSYLCSQTLDYSNQFTCTVGSVCSHFGVALWGFKCVSSLQTVLLSLCVYFYRLFFSRPNVVKHDSLQSSLACTSLGGNSDITEPLVNHDLLADLSYDHRVSTGHE